MQLWFAYLLGEAEGSKALLGILVQVFLAVCCNALLVFIQLLWKRYIIIDGGFEKDNIA